MSERDEMWERRTRGPGEVMEAIIDWAHSEVSSATAALREERDALSAEVSRLQALLEAKQPAKAPAAPRVLPEHLAFLEAIADYWGSSHGSDIGSAGRTAIADALRAAVARRDGGAK